MTDHTSERDRVDDYDPDGARDGVVCPRCMGGGTEDCHCGGDLCVCENYGEMDCRVCYGEGTVSEKRADQYDESRRQWFATMKALSPSNGGSGE